MEKDKYSHLQNEEITTNDDSLQDLEFREQQEYYTSSDYSYKEDPKLETLFNPEIEDMFPALLRGVREIRDEISNGRYTLLIGDDTSGRIPTLILRKIISQVNSSKGRPTIPAFFVKGNRIKNEENLQKQQLTKYIRQAKVGSDNHKALITTDYMHLGGSIKQIGTVLQNEDINFDVFSIARKFDTQKYFPRNQSGRNVEIFPRNKEDDVAPRIFGKIKLSGYQFNEGQIQFLPKYKNSFREARKDVETVANTIINDVFTS